MSTRTPLPERLTITPIRTLAGTVRWWELRDSAGFVIARADDPLAHETWCRQNGYRYHYNPHSHRPTSTH